MRAVISFSIASFAAFSSALLSGCAIHYYDEASGVENIWGVGHMRMKVQEPREGRQAVVSGTELYGVGAGTNHGGAFASLGWFKNHETVILNEDAQFRVEWPNTDFFSVRVGSELPQPIPANASNEKLPSNNMN